MIRIGGPASPYDPTYHLLLRFDKIAEIVERERPDVLEIHSPYLAALGALRVRREAYGVRTFQWHSDFIDTYAGVLGARLTSGATGAGLGAIAASAVQGGTRPLWGLVRAIARRCDATLVAARWQVDKLVSHGVPRVHRVPFGVERRIFTPAARSYEGRRALLARVGRDASSEVPVLVGVGRFAIEKRWDVVLDAFFALTRTTDAVLILFGDGPERARMQARIEAHAAERGVTAAGSVAMPGFEKDRAALARALASADVLVHGCPFETFGLSIAEALSCGLPVVVPDAGGAGEMYDPAAAEHYPALDVEAFARATERMLARVSEPAAATTVRAAAAAAVQRYPTVEGQFDAQLALYRDLLARARGRSAARN